MSFLKYTAGAVPGKAPKRQVAESEEEKKKRLKKYEEGRERQFQASWKNGRPWLVYLEKERMMRCEWCIEGDKEEGKKNAFIDGATLMKLETVKQHESSKQHLKNASKYTRKAPAQSEAGRCLTKLKEADYSKLVIKFRTVHALAKANLSFRTYNTLCQLDKAKGLDIGDTYTNDKAAAQFLRSIAQCLKDQIGVTIRRSNYVSFTCDGSTDYTGEELESIAVRTCIDGKIADSFFCIGRPQSGSSADIHTYIIGAFKDMGLENALRSKFVGFCADGASTMQGHISGLAALVKKDWPHAVSIHCLAHRLELAFKDATKKASPQLYTRTITLLLGLYYLYRRSPKQKKALQNSYESLGMKQILPTRVGGTRWLPHLVRAINAFLKGYKAFRFQLDSASHESPKAEGLAKLAGDGNLLVYILFLKEVVDHLMKLSLCLQKRDLCLADAHTRVTATQTVLKSMLTREIPCIESVQGNGEFQELKLTFRGKNQLDSCREEFISSCIETLEKRFKNSSLMQATCIATLNNWPSCNSSEFGVKEIELLYEQFSCIMEEASLATLLSEWQLLKALVYERYPNLKVS